MNLEKRQIHWTEYFRTLTPIALFIVSGFAAMIYSKIMDIDQKLFHHLCNDEIHMPRSQYVSRGEFDMQCKFFEKENDRVIKAIDELRNELKSGRVDTKK